MTATYNADGSVTLTMTRAEAHVAAWGGEVEVHNAVEQNVRQAIVAAEDALPDAVYGAIMVEVDTLAGSLRSEPIEVGEADA